jgi:hypothetical protein
MDFKEGGKGEKDIKEGGKGEKI